MDERENEKGGITVVISDATVGKVNNVIPKLEIRQDDDEESVTVSSSCATVTLKFSPFDWKRRNEDNPVEIIKQATVHFNDDQLCVKPISDDGMEEEANVGICSQHYYGERVDGSYDMSNTLLHL